MMQHKKVLKKMICVFLFGLLFWGIHSSDYIPDCFEYRMDYELPSSWNGAEVQLVIDTKNLMASGHLVSCSRMRFRQQNTEAWLDFWIESSCDDIQTRVWLSPTNDIPGLDITIELYYGCQEESSPISPPEQYGTELTWNGAFIAMAAGDCPNNWNDVTPFFQDRYIRVNSSQTIPKQIRGSIATHNHTTNSEAAVSWDTDNKQDQVTTNYCAEDWDGGHSLRTVDCDVGSPTANPLSRNLQFCESPTLNLEDSMVVPIRTSSYMISSTRFLRYDAQDGYLLFGGPCCTVGGALSHTHQISGETAGPNGCRWKTVGGDAVAGCPHKHPIVAFETSSAENWPTYLDVAFAQVSSALGAELFSDADEIVVFLNGDLPPMGFETVPSFDNVYLRGASARSGPISPTSGHHSAASVTILASPDAATASGPGTGPGVNSLAHLHDSPSYATADEPDKDDLRRVELRAIKYKTVAFQEGYGALPAAEVVIVRPQPDRDPSDGPIHYLYYVAIGGGGVGLLLLLLTTVFVLCLVCCFCRQKRAVVGEQELLETANPPSSSTDTPQTKAEEKEIFEFLEHIV